jgi:hypothetical protein
VKAQRQPTPTHLDWLDAAAVQVQIPTSCPELSVIRFWMSKFGCTSPNFSCEPFNSVDCRKQSNIVRYKSMTPLDPIVSVWPTRRNKYSESPSSFSFTEAYAMVF